MTTRIICLGNTTLDRVWPLTEMPSKSGKYRANGYMEVGGGTAANAAVAAARLGGQVAYWGRAGDDPAGHTMQAEMAEYDVDISHFRLFPGGKSSISAVLVAQDGERLIVNFRGADMPESADWLPLEQVYSADVVHADMRWVAGAQAMFKAARSRDIPTVLDGESADDGAFATILPLVDHAIFSEPGLRAFVGDATLDHRYYAAALEKVRMRGCAVAAVTQGENGTLWLDAKGIHRLPSFEVDVVDTTGAGDVFHGAYALALGEGQSVAEAIRFSSAVSALKCMKPGGRAGIPTREEVMTFLAQRK